MSARYGAGRRGMRTVLGVATALGAASGFVGVLATGTGAAQAATPTLQYTCTFPVIGGEPITARISTDIPTSLAVGESSPRFAINAAATVDGNFTFGLRQILGVRIIEGSLDADTDVTAPLGRISVPVHLTITRTSIPASGSFDIPATGTAPSLTFSKPGSAKITAGGFTLHLVPEDANGNLTAPGRIDVPCTLNSGQDDVVSSFEITARRTTAAPATSPTPGSPSTGRPTAPATTTTPATPATHSTTSSPSPSTSPSPTSTPVGSGSATAMITTAATPDPTGSTINAATTGTTTTGGGPSTGNLILLAAGILAAATAAVALRFGPRLRNRRRPDEDG